MALYEPAFFRGRKTLDSIAVEKLRFTL